MNGRGRLCLAFGAALALACTRADGGGPAPRASSDPTEETWPAPPLPRAHVTLPDAFGARHRLTVEVAATPTSRERGLMWRRKLEDGQGMLFVFPSEQIQSFWMKNTLIPLDMLFIDEARRVVGIVEQAEPRTLIPRTVGRPSLYVLEVPGGWSARTGVRPGTTVVLEDLPPGPPR